MMKRILAISLALALVFLVGCKKDRLEEFSSVPESSVQKEPENPYKINPLTGLQNLDPSLVNRRPVSIMINNISVAQPVQTGINKADIVYETEVEGGITRLMAVYKNIQSVGQIGTVRSARYVYVDLALGHDAVYMHHGQDATYCAPHLNDVNHLTVDTNGVMGKRISNGLATEHTLYGYGDKIWNQIAAKFRTTTEKTSPWQNFASEKESLTLTGGTANVVTVPFQYSATFTYEPETGLYARSTRGGVRNDYVTGETVKFKNVFVLSSTIVNYPDGKHRNVYLEGGDGYYIVNGTFMPIRWTKGSSTNPIKFTDSTGAPLKVNAGNSWVFIVNGSTTVPSFS